MFRYSFIYLFSVTQWKFEMKNTQHILFLNSETKFLSLYLLEFFFVAQQKFPINRLFFSLNIKLATSTNSLNSLLWYSIKLLTKNLFFPQGYIFYSQTQKERVRRSRCRQNVTHWRCKRPLYFSKIYLHYIPKKTVNILSYIVLFCM